jgi:hypothetical protein
MTWCSGIAYIKIEDEGVRARVFNATFKNISDISLRSVLLVGETVVSCENHRPAASHCQTALHKVVLDKRNHIP